MRVTLGLGDESRYEDITKRAWTSPHDIRRDLQNKIQSLKATRFKDMVANNDSADMFDRLLIKLVDNTSYEIRLPSYEFGQNLVDLYEALTECNDTIDKFGYYESGTKLNEAVPLFMKKQLTLLMAALLLLSCSAKRAAEKTSAADSDVNYSEFFTGKTMVL